ncbi:uncharacterized protein CCR75_008848 [Bremia lactucae]|uniref:GYF domain-containing protein n=1 Tax=Bremia lactucae TaxID=4779 RepID=A0A976IKQ4_BRELC|nr:hypothetical protein CCR75_008848 [Bremia lactucae]
MVRREMTGFNLDEEKDEGHFDDDGNYVWSKEAKKVQEDAWLENISRQQMGAANSAKNRREIRDEQVEETMTIEESTKILAMLLGPRENVLHALKRIGSKKPSRIRPGEKRKQAQWSESELAQTAEEKEQFEQITEAADFLMRLGKVDVYVRTKEDFHREEKRLVHGRRENKSFEIECKNEEILPKQENFWEYKAADGQIYGPYPTSNFLAWQQQGYFKGDKAVDMRQLQMSDYNSEKLKVKRDEFPFEHDLLNDFEDSEDKAINVDTRVEKAGEIPWRRSDTIDFFAYS